MSITTGELVKEINLPTSERSRAAIVHRVVFFGPTEPVRAVLSEGLQCSVHLLATGVNRLSPTAHQRAVSEPVCLQT